MAKKLQDSPDLFGPELFLLSGGRDHPLSTRGGPGPMHRGDQGPSLLAPGCHARSALRCAEPRRRHLHDFLRRSYQSDPVPRTALLLGGGSDRHVQPSDAGRGEEHPAGPARLDGFDGVPPSQPASAQSHLLQGSGPALLLAPNRRPGHRPHHPVRAEAESTGGARSTLLTGPLWLAGRPDRSAVAAVRLRDGSGYRLPRGGGDRRHHQAHGKSEALSDATTTTGDDANAAGGDPDAAGEARSPPARADTSLSLAESDAARSPIVSSQLPVLVLDAGRQQSLDAGSAARAAPA